MENLNAERTNTNPNSIPNLVISIYSKQEIILEQVMELKQIRSTIINEEPVPNGAALKENEIPNRNPESLVQALQIHEKALARIIGLFREELDILRNTLIP